ncbi:hypothetical protein [Staphylococcus auricularis]|uniref:hypothetical protein n=1 Tax=Staphylococcus auricularis TaxID=29379 RepID=UPI001784D916|nr:hypothetical protein [Staphylococcus auricularis]
MGLDEGENDGLIERLKEMGELGNRVMVVEEDDDRMGEGDYLVDVGGGGGD